LFIGNGANNFLLFSQQLLIVFTLYCAIIQKQEIGENDVALFVLMSENRK